MVIRSVHRLSYSLLGWCMSLQACPNVTLEDVAVLGECCPSGRGPSLNLLVLVFVSRAVSLSLVDVAFNLLDLGVVGTGVSFSIITSVFYLFVFRP